MRHQSGLRRQPLRAQLPRRDDPVRAELREHLERRVELRHVRRDVHRWHGLLLGCLCVLTGVDVVLRLVHQHGDEPEELRRVPSSLPRQSCVCDERVHRVSIVHGRPVLWALRRHDELEHQLRRLRRHVRDGAHLRGRCVHAVAALQ